MSGVLEMFEEYCSLNDEDAPITLTGDFNDQTWFKVYIFNLHLQSTKKRLIRQKSFSL